MGAFSFRFVPRNCLISLTSLLLISNVSCVPAKTMPSLKSNVPLSPAMLDCFARSVGRALSNASSSNEFFNVSPDDCLRFCSTERACNTVVYHKHFSTCQLYSGAEEGDTAREVSAKGHDLYVKKECEENRREQERDEAENTAPKGGKL